MVETAAIIAGYALIDPLEKSLGKELTEGEFETQNQNLNDGFCFILNYSTITISWTNQ